MVCIRCQMEVKSELEKLGLHHTKVELGETEIMEELLVYDELSLTEIAYKLHYSSVAHLSNQFKKMTGLTPSHFKNLKNKTRRALGNV
ncbi:MAG: helix-turn-helix domain-containing protein [Bacteroidales bacterium]|nr:helix-turn-helix domain-containing protein [Bacteroidales bacterium]